MLSTVTALAVLVLLRQGITCNHALTLGLSLTVLTIWRHDKVNGFIAGVVFFLIKTVFLRIAYTVDYRTGGDGGSDLLGMAPAVLLAGFIVWELGLEVMNGKYLLKGRTQVLMGIFAGLSFLSIFNPMNSIIIGLGGFERNILPNMLVLFLTVIIIKDRVQADKLVKALTVLGLVSCVYGLGQYALGMYSWEKDWLTQKIVIEGSTGWLTIGLRGIEFRVFSLFYNYMDFTFANVLIFLMAYATGKNWIDGWKKVRTAYFILWVVMLSVTLERTPMIMCLTGMGLTYLLKSTVQKRKKLLGTIAVCLILLFSVLNISGEYLRNTGASTLIRLAELANPLNADSINDRVERKWLPTLDIIESNPMGVGVGYGSGTRAHDMAQKSGLLIEPHNEFLQKCLETGIGGGLLFLFLVFSVFKDARRLIKNNIKANEYGYGMAGVTAGFLVCGMVNLPFSGASGLLFWSCAGVIIALGRKKEFYDKEAETAESGSMPEKV